VEGSCEHGNEPSGSVKCWEIHGLLSDWQLIKKDSEYVTEGRWSETP
jgi:hypothetical protein